LRSAYQLSLTFLTVCTQTAVLFVMYLNIIWYRIFCNWYSTTNMMHVLFNLLRIKGLYMFWALLAHLQE
jgi:hypothetical protein